MRTRLLIAMTVFAALVTHTRAQGLGFPQPITTIDSGTACSVANTCATFATAGATVIALDVDSGGSATGTLTAEGSVNGAAFRTMLMTNAADGTTTSAITAAGTYIVPNVGFTVVRLRATAAISNTFTVSAARGYFSAKVLGPTYTNVTATGQFFAPATCATIGYSFTGRTTTGVCSSANNTVDLFTNNVSRLSISTTAVTSGLPFTSTGNLLSASAIATPLNGWYHESETTSADLAIGSAQAYRFGLTAMVVRSDGTLNWSSTTSPRSSTDVTLRRSAAKTLTIDTDGSGGALTVINFATNAFQVTGNAFGTSTIGPSSVSGTTITAALVMAGLGGSFTTRTGRFEICMSGNLDNTTLNDGSKVQISFGTNATPALNAPLQGTQVGPIQQLSQAALPAATITPFGACWLVTGQAVNTAFWTDLAYGAITGGTAVLSQASVVAHDIP